jgi:hypothetical protein
MKRRLIFRKGLDSFVGKIKAVLEIEKDRRTNFVNTQVQYLPSHFWPQLRDMPATLKVEGEPKEYEFPDLKGCADIKCDENMFEGFGNFESS